MTMRIAIVAVGRLKDGPERELLARYVERAMDAGRSLALGPLEVREIPESRAQSAELRQTDEAERLLAKSKGASRLIALDERGKPLTSIAFAGLIRDCRDGGESELAFLVGGPDGHGKSVREAARPLLSLGPMTLPHGLARIVLAEQLYRTVTILSGHPYHRA